MKMMIYQIGLSNINLTFLKGGDKLDKLLELEKEFYDLLIKLKEKYNKK